METREFLLNVSRICESSSSCSSGCLLGFFCHCPYNEQTKEDFEKVERVVKEWAKVHPVKTRQTTFLEAYLNAAVAYGTIDILPCKLDKTLAEDCDGGHPRECVECKNAYWSKEVE